MRRWRWLKLGGLAALAGALGLSAAFLENVTRPAFGPATLRVAGDAPRTFAYPFDWRGTQRTRFILVQEVELPRLHPNVFTFYPRDFLWAMEVNGHRVDAPGLPLSAASLEGRSIDLAPFLHPGRNEIVLQMERRWREAGLRLAVSPRDRLSLAWLALTGAAMIAAGVLVANVAGVSLPRAEGLLLLAGIALRLVYVMGTPYFVRSFDYWGHADDLDYVARHLRLPPAGANWEAFQAPLYYLLAGGVTRIMESLGMPEDQRYALWQGLSLLESIGVLLVGRAVASLLYPEDRDSRLGMVAVLAVAPPLVFNAARVSNDGLLTLLEFSWLAILLRYWRRPRMVTWAWLAVVLGLALVTKASALVLAAVSGLCLAADSRAGLKTRGMRLGALLAIVAVMAGGYYLPRCFQATALNTYVVGNLASLNPCAHIDGVLEKSFVFNPARIIRYPFDEAWGPRHDYFLEVFFKTMLMGDWIKGEFYKIPGRIMVSVALLLIIPFGAGLYRALRRREFFDGPLLATLGGVLAAQWLFLQMAPFLSTLDFRFSVILLVPIIHYVGRGIREGPGWWRGFATLLLQVAVLNSAIYLVMLSTGS